MAMGLCFNQPLDGDTCGLGIAALALPVDPFLLHIGFPAMNPYLFLDMIIGVPLQLLTGGSPEAIKFAGYLFYALIVASIVGLVFWMTRDKTRSILAGALLMCLGIRTEILLSQTLYHVPTMAAALIYTAYFYKVDERRPKELAVPLLLSVPILFSDLLFAFMFVVPFAILTVSRHIRRPGEKIINSAFSTVYFIAAALFTMGLKYMLGYVGKPLLLTTPSMLPDVLLSLAYDLARLLNSSLNYASNGVVAILFITWLCLLAYVVLRSDRGALHGNDRARYGLWMLAVASLVIMAGYIAFYTMSFDRYLLPMIFFLVIGVALLYNPRDRSVAMALCFIMLVGIVLNASYLLKEPAPNAAHYALIDYLEENNLSYGYGDFNTANTITYLTHGKIKVLGCEYENGTVYLHNWLNERLWYQPGRAFIVTGETDLEAPGANVTVLENPRVLGVLK